MPRSPGAEAVIASLGSDIPLLEVVYGSQRIRNPGEEIPRSVAAEHPTVGYNVEHGTYLLVCLDLDAPFPSMPVLGPILHWIQSDLQPQPAAGSVASLTAAKDVPPACSYIAPRPPPLSSPHRYVFLLYEQPSNFSPKNFEVLSTSGRMRWDHEAFERKAGLGPVIAANYFKSN